MADIVNCVYNLCQLRERRSGHTRAYIETFIPPEILRVGMSERVADPRSIAVRNVFGFRDTLHILFYGSTDDRSRVVDLYAGDSLAYAGSYRLPFGALAVARIEDTFFLLTFRQGVYGLAAVRVRGAQGT